MSRWQEPNLAHAPFVNERPVRRLAVTLWLLFVVTSAAGLWMSRTIRKETGTLVAQLVRVNAETANDRQRAKTLEAELLRADLPAQNVRTEFLNRRIAERSFSWSRLLETLTHEMPRSVRLLRLTPEGFTRERGRGAAETRAVVATRVALRIAGEAEDTEALLEFVDRLFQHPAFDQPNLFRENGRKDFKIQFDLEVDYLPQIADGPATSIAATGATSPSVVARAGAVELRGVESSHSPDAAKEAGDASSSTATGAARPTVRDAPELGRKAAPADRRRGSDFGESSARGEAESAGALPSGSLEDGTVAKSRRATSQPGNTGAPASEPNFPFTVMPTALKPYASGARGRS